MIEGILVIIAIIAMHICSQMMLKDDMRKTGMVVMYGEKYSVTPIKEMNDDSKDS